jgi:hypothetical protein
MFEDGFPGLCEAFGQTRSGCRRVEVSGGGFVNDDARF